MASDTIRETLEPNHEIIVATAHGYTIFTANVDETVDKDIIHRVEDLGGMDPMTNLQRAKQWLINRG